MQWKIWPFTLFLTNYSKALQLGLQICAPPASDIPEYLLHSLSGRLATKAHMLSREKYLALEYNKASGYACFD